MIRTLMLFATSLFTPEQITSSNHALLISGAQGADSKYHGIQVCNMKRYLMDKENYDEQQITTFAYDPPVNCASYNGSNLTVDSLEKAIKNIKADNVFVYILDSGIPYHVDFPDTYIRVTQYLSRIDCSDLIVMVDSPHVMIEVDQLKENTNVIILPYKSSYDALITRIEK